MSQGVPQYYAGQLRHRIQIIKPDPTATPNSYNETDASQTIVVGTFPCDINPLAGNELEIAMQRWAMAKYQIVMRHQPGMNFGGAMFAIWILPTGNRKLDILNVNDPGEDSPWVIMTARDYDS